MVDVTTDNMVVVTAASNREEGTPESALWFAARLRRESPLLEEVAKAVEHAAHTAIRRRQSKLPPPS